MVVIAKLPDSILFYFIFLSCTTSLFVRAVCVLTSKVSLQGPQQEYD